MRDKEQEVTLELGLTKAVRAIWPGLHEARKFKDEQGRENGEPKYSATFLIPADHPDLKAHKQEVAKLARAKFGAASDLKTLKFPFVSGDDEAMKAIEKGKDRSYCAGAVLLKTASQYPVAVFDARRRDAQGQPILVSEPEAIKALIYSGCQVAAQVKYRTYRVGSNQPGVTAYLQKVCFVADGERIAGSVSGDVFRSVQGAVTTADPTGGAELDDEIPF